MNKQNREGEGKAPFIAEGSLPDGYVSGGTPSKKSFGKLVDGDKLTDISSVAMTANPLATLATPSRSNPMTALGAFPPKAVKKSTKY